MLLVNKFIKPKRSSTIVYANKGKSVGIVGAGGVGSAIASSLIHRNIVNNIKITDANSTLCEGVALDLQDEGFISGTSVENVTVDKLRKCDIVIVTAGAKQQPDEPRTNLIKRNATILHRILTSLFPLKPNTIIIIVTNPVDILTNLAQKWCSDYIPSNQVIGSGTYLDSQRLRVALAKRLNISVKSIHAYVVGEHGDSQVVARSAASIGGSPLSDIYKFQDEEFEEIEKEVCHKAYEIIKRKGATFHGIGACVATIVEAIILDKHEIIPISSYHKEYDTFIGWPSIVGAEGVKNTIPLKLISSEMEKVEKSAKIIKDHVDEIYTTLS